MTIIDNTKDPACPYRFIPTPVFRTEYERQKYWSEEKQKWREGHSDLTGMHYYYLSQCKIKDADGAPTRPIFRDVDMWVFEAIAKGISIEYDVGVIKRREFGLTSIGAGCLPNYFMRVYPGSTSLMTSCDKPRIFRAFEDKTAFVYDRLHDDIRPKEMNRNQTKESVYLKVQIKEKLEDGDIDIRESDFFCSETTKNPNAFSSSRCKYAFFDEFPLHTNRKAVLTSTRPCFMRGTKKNGFLLWGGTVEHGIANETLSELRSIVADSENSRTLIFFVEPWMGLEQFMSPNGWSNKEKGMEWVNREIERYSKMEDKTDLLAFKKNYPRSLEEALEMSDEGIFPQEVVAKINEQNKRLMIEQPPVARYDIEGGVAQINQSKGKFYILSHPEKGKTYIAGTDPIPFSNNDINDGSEYALAIKCRDTDTYVAFYSERNMNADVVTMNSIKLQDYYGGAKTMLERNVGGVILEKYKDFGRYHDLLADKPSSLGIKFSDNRITKGYYKNDKMAQRGNELLIKYLLHHTENIFFKRILEELGDYLIKNTDLIDAIVACEIYDANMVRKNAASIKRPVEREIQVVVRDASGKTRIEWKKVSISQDDIK